MVLLTPMTTTIFEGWKFSDTSFPTSTGNSTWAAPPGRVDVVEVVAEVVLLVADVVDVVVVVELLVEEDKDVLDVMAVVALVVGEAVEVETVDLVVLA